MVLIIQHLTIESPGLIGEFFKNSGYKIKIVDFQKRHKLPKSLKGIEAVISLGGSMNVYEEEKHPFLKQENIFLKRIITSKIPFLGICLGSQLLAKARGAQVKKAKKSEIGWFDVDFSFI